MFSGGAKRPGYGVSKPGTRQADGGTHELTRVRVKQTGVRANLRGKREADLVRVKQNVGTGEASFGERGGRPLYQ